MIKQIILITLTLLLTTQTLINSDQRRIAIYDFNARGVSKYTAEVVSDWIRTAITNSNVIIIES